MNTQRKEALFYIDDLSSKNYSGLRSGWDYDDRGDGNFPNSQGGVWILKKTTDIGPVTLKRDFHPIYDGKFTFEILINLTSGTGFFFEFLNKKEIGIKLIERNQKLFCENDEICDFQYGKHYLKFIVDKDNKTLDIFVDKKFVGNGKYDKDLPEINSFKCGYDVSDFGETTLIFAKLYVNFFVFDKCLSQMPGELPCDYDIKTTGEAKVYTGKTVENKAACSYFSENKKGAISYISKKIDKATGIVAFETKYLLPEYNGKLTIGMTCGEKTGVSVYDCGGALISFDNYDLRSHQKNVWQTLRIEADTNLGKALVKLNGKKTKVVNFNETVSYFDGIEFVYEAYEDSKMLFSDMSVWNILPEPEDYVPEPIPAKKNGDYFVGMNICSLWRTGDHCGWDCISPFDEIKPLMGYYDEGLPEVADWEIKWMCEHGIDFELYCWYSAEEDAPQKNTVLSSAIHGGHFNAKYSDKVKLALLWEAANCAHPKGVESFKKYLVPYWLDYFFSDPRYMTIDGKAIMSIFGTWQLIKDFGGVENTRMAFDYLRKEVKKLGYKDLIIMSCGGADQTMADCGLDAVHAYNWGKLGYDPEYTKECVLSNTNKNLIHVVPTVSSGFNNVGWASTRSPNMSTEDLESTLQWFKDEMLPKYDKNSWKSKLCMLSTWNEYGEGTYMCPSNLNRFGYLDAVRNVFCENTPHEDIAPNENQKQRLGYLHPQDRAIIARLDWEKMPIQNEKSLYKWTFKTKEDLDKWELLNLDGAEIKDGMLVCNTTKLDPIMILKDKINFISAKVSHAKVKIKCYKEEKSQDCIQLYFKRDSQEEFSGYQVSTVLTEPLELADLILPLQENSKWDGNITGLRFDPIYGAGYFALESIELMETVPHKYIYVNNLGVFFGLFPDEEDGEIYIPLAPKSGLFRKLHIYHEWNKAEKTIFIEANDKEVEITVGKDSMKINGREEKLIKPMYMKDGLPMLALNDLKKICSFDYSINGDDVNINLK